MNYIRNFPSLWFSFVFRCDRDDFFLFWPEDKNIRRENSRRAINCYRDWKRHSSPFWEISDYSGEYFDPSLCATRTLKQMDIRNKFRDWWRVILRFDVSLTETPVSSKMLATSTMTFCNFNEIFNALIDTYWSWVNMLRISIQTEFWYNFHSCRILIYKNMTGASCCMSHVRDLHIAKFFHLNVHYPWGKVHLFSRTYTPLEELNLPSVPPSYEKHAFFKINQGRGKTYRLIMVKYKSEASFYKWNGFFDGWTCGTETGNKMSPKNLKSMNLTMSGSSLQAKTLFRDMGFLQRYRAHLIGHEAEFSEVEGFGITSFHIHDIFQNNSLWWSTYFYPKFCYKMSFFKKKHLYCRFGDNLIPPNQIVSASGAWLLTCLFCPTPAAGLAIKAKKNTVHQLFVQMFVMPPEFFGSSSERLWRRCAFGMGTPRPFGARWSRTIRQRPSASQAPRRPRARCSSHRCRPLITFLRLIFGPKCGFWTLDLLHIL